MATVKVKFRPSVIPDKEGSIFYQVIHNRIPRQIATDYKVFPFEWNEGCANVVCSQSSPRANYILLIRERIKADLERLGRIVRTMEMSRSDYSSDEIVEEYERLGVQNSLYKYMSDIIAKLKYNGKMRTSEAYKSALNSFLNYRNGEDIMLDYVNKDVMESYEGWLRQKGVSANTVSFYTRILRAVYNRAVEENLTENRRPFRRVYTGIEKTVKRALPMDVVKQIKNLDLTLRPDLAYARDMFILSFMLRGMSFIDMAFLRKSDLKNGHVTYRRRKTGQLLSIQWTAEMQEIVDRYPKNETKYLLPIIRNSQSDPLYAYRNVGYNVNRHLGAIARSIDLPMSLTMYVARHSWASAAKVKGIPVSVISEGMGHDSELTTQIYLASLDTSVVDHANSLLIRDLNRK